MSEQVLDDPVELAARALEVQAEALRAQACALRAMRSASGEKSTSGPLVDKSTLAKALDASIPTIDRLCRASVIPFVYVGDVRRFDVAAVRAALEKHTEEKRRAAKAAAYVERDDESSARSSVPFEGDSSPGVVSVEPVPRRPWLVASERTAGQRWSCRLARCRPERARQPGCPSLAAKARGALIDRKYPTCQKRLTPSISLLGQVNNVRR